MITSADCFVREVTASLEAFWSNVDQLNSVCKEILRVIVIAFVFLVVLISVCRLLETLLERRAKEKKAPKLAEVDGILGGNGEGERQEMKYGVKQANNKREEVGERTVENKRRSLKDDCGATNFEKKSASCVTNV